MSAPEEHLDNVLNKENKDKNAILPMFGACQSKPSSILIKTNADAKKTTNALQASTVFKPSKQRLLDPDEEERIKKRLLSGVIMLSKSLPQLRMGGPSRHVIIPKKFGFPIYVKDKDIDGCPPNEII